ncbi:MAG: HAD hydrolase family protein [Candidatus Omnitrophica bacterium]|nr:HAD hydrolase family protein [Candidatus Omnitrophota bacterium]
MLSRMRCVTALVLDVDGVLTDGRIIYDEFGDELKCFDVQDGTGLVFWHRAGLKSAIITARKSRMVKRRAKEMAVDFLAQNAFKKVPAYERFLRQYRLLPEQVCALGDDLMELPILRRVGLAVAVQNAVPEIKATSHYVTSQPGGRGAVREVIELILNAKGLWQQLTLVYKVAANE